ncbi:acetyl-CoA acetyltransferase [Arenicella xantha]|uniref:Acetyl-CoA C-acetyltransferase n=1 Tax=Arenicella xantha TaxID=644221 RepID=A0A395JJ56_9GAMM|nr:acetyl-CoA acetyltransferase [Arenicella xantha]RBP50721.1 acetyl-CoA C-acetyltransferase [Arenicella xantha]
MNTKPIYILGGYQTDFSRNWSRDGNTVYDLFSSTVKSGLASSGIDASEVEVGHVANFEGSLYTGQSHLGGFFGHVDPAMQTMPASRHEAACASGSMAMLAAMADLESERYGLACVVGIEVMRQKFDDSLDRLQGAAWVGEEWQDANFVWPRAFSDMIDAYQNRYGINNNHLAAISQKNFDNAKHNPNAQSRNWSFSDEAFKPSNQATDQDAAQANPVIEGNIRRLDCGQVTDGAATVFLATQERAQEYALKHGKNLADIPQIKGWGHINAPMLFSEKLRSGANSPFLLPHVNTLFCQTLRRAGLASLDDIHGLELHDCFNITEYMILDHAGLNRPGEIWQSIEQEYFVKDGKLPVNVSGGLIGLGHPVGATGVRMALDCYKQTTNQAGDMQIDECQTMMTFNLGGSTTTCASLIIGT